SSGLRVALHAEEELRAHEEPFHRALNADLKPPLLASFFIESEQRLDVRVRNRPPERAAGHGRDNRLRTGGFVGGLRRPAHEYTAAARRVSRFGDGERADDLHVAEIGALLRRIVTVRSTWDRLLERLEKVLEQRRGAVQER